VARRQSNMLIIASVILKHGQNKVGYNEIEEELKGVLTRKQIMDGVMRLKKFDVLSTVEKKNEKGENVFSITPRRINRTREILEEAELI